MADDVEDALKNFILDTALSVRDRLRAINALLKYQRDKIKVDNAAAKRAKAEALRAKEQAHRHEAAAKSKAMTVELSKAAKKFARTKKVAGIGGGTDGQIGSVAPSN